MIPKRIATALLHSMTAGVTPRTGLPYIAIGRQAEIAALLNDLSSIESGGSAFRLITGRYGSGKSFLLGLIRGHALDRGFAVMDADLSPERRLTGSHGQGLATYRELMKNLSTKASPDGGALPSILARYISSLQLEAAQELSAAPGDPRVAAAVERKVLEAVLQFSGLVQGFDFSAAITHYYRGHISGDEVMKQSALRWLRGEYETKTEAKKELPVGSIIEDGNWYEALKLMAAFLGVAGYKGLLVCLDEAVNLYKIVHSPTRELNYEKLLTLFNDSMQGRISGLGFLVGGTPQFVEDTRRGLFSYEAMRTRLASNRYAKDGLVDTTGPVLPLSPLTPEELFALLTRIQAIHGEYYEYEPAVTPEELLVFLKEQVGRMGADVLLTPREVVRDFIGLLNVMHQNPGTAFADLVKQKPASEAPADDFTEFTL
jgi:hypothetical protein